jgi:hypothetical protein
MKEKINKKGIDKEEIQGLGLNAIKEYFKIDVSKLEPSLLVHLHNKAKIGMQFEREMNLSKRAIEMNYIRVFRMIAEDKKELRKFIKKSLPQYSPI